MKSNLIASLITATFLCATFSTAALAGDRHHRKNTFRDYARVVHVEPHYRVVTKRTPQRTCDTHHRHQPHRSSNHHRGHRRHSSEAVFVSGVIGGAIGHELSRSINGKSHPGAVIAGAAVGAGLVASHQQHRRHHNNHRRHRQPHCTTTEHVQRIRQPDGYMVTYRFRGQTFRTHTHYHPGDRIPVKVAISTGY